VEEGKLMAGVNKRDFDRDSWRGSLESGVKWEWHSRRRAAGEQKVLCLLQN